MNEDENREIIKPGTGSSPSTMMSELFGQALVSKAKETVATDKDLSELGVQVAKLGAIGEALGDKETQESMKAGEKERLKNEVKADTLKSITKVHEAKSAKETTLYERYDYVFRLVGIKAKIPSFMCAIILVLYGIFGTALTLTFGLLFMTVNFIIDGMTGIFGGLSQLLDKTRGAAKGFALTAVFLLILGLVALCVWLIVKYVVL